MVVDMMQAVSNMLDQTGIVEPDDTQAYMVKAQCAKIMLDQIIKGMSNSDNPPVMFRRDPHAGIPEPDKTPEPKPAPQTERTKKEDKRGIEVENGIIKRFIDCPPETRIELDGKVMSINDAVGKTFQNAKFVD